MYSSLNLFRVAGSMAQHASQRQALTAQNIANADTPGYRARSIAPFSETFRDDPTPVALRQTRAGHLAGGQLSAQARVEFADTEASPNGNTVSLEEEMVNAVNIQREHGRALAIYQHGMKVLRTTLGR
ncbi:FlgB family protein [Loktanella sp. IMCC34160]|uniref:FlgB family protein n=1 Tax=Loktanella sp. IMCC34160 TaxID=2510646 RepID=UPI00101E1EC5|nr:FlgB family protein [Loktanella sp. IMCC34160]RYG91475.1 FlgB family protein [Loktanella sp. IMCC34160]